MNASARSIAQDRSASSQSNARRASEIHAARRDSSGIGAPSSRRGRSLLVLLALAIAALAISAAPALAAPTVTTPVVSDVAYTTAKVSSEVDAQGGGFTSYAFQVSTNGTDWTDSVSGGFFAPETLNAELTGLATDTHYFVRLVAKKGFGGVSDPETISAGPNPEFTTLAADPPTIPGEVAATEIFSTSATGTGEVNRPGASDNVSCQFEYVNDDQFDANPPASRFDGAAVRSCTPNPIEEPGTKPVSATLGCTNPVADPGSCLDPATTYHLRLVVASAGGQAIKEAATTFTTAAKVAAPTVIAANDTTEVSYQTAKVSGEVQRPSGDDPALNTSCRFEYVADEQFQLDQFASAGQAECAEAPSSAPLASTDPTPVTAELGGLDTGTVYHLRLTAANGAGTASKDASTFETTPGVEPTFEVHPIAPEDVGYTTVQASATVDSGKPDHPMIFQFQVSPDPSAGWFAENGFVHTAEPGKNDYISQGLPFTEGAPKLKPGTTYYVRINAVDYFFPGDYFGGTEVNSPAPYQSFTTKGTSDPPLASCDPIPGSIATTAHISCHVDPNAPSGPLPDDAKALYKTSWKIECNPECTDVNGNGFSGIIDAEAGSQSVSADLAHLEPNQHYEVRVIATNGLGATKATVRTFDTDNIPPSVKQTPGASDGEGGYTLQGIVNPNNQAITGCEFEWGPDANEYAFSAPCSPMPAGRSEVQLVKVHEALSGQFRLSYRGETTGDISADAPAAIVESELEALAAIGPNITVTGGPDPYVISFEGSLAETNVGQVEIEKGTIPPTGTSQTKLSASTQVDGGNAIPITVEAHLTNLNRAVDYHALLVVTYGTGSEALGSDQAFKATLTERESCPVNEQQRIESNSLALPECRAYEMVTPPGKEGFGAGFASYDGGARVAYYSGAGNLAKSGQNRQFNMYVAQRSAAGWETIPNLNGSSGSVYDSPSDVIPVLAGNWMYGFSADLRSSVWFLDTKDKPDDDHLFHQYLRDPDGTFEVIGSTTSTSGGPFQGAVALSADLSHLVTWASSDSRSEWGPGVYEYVGTGMAEPRRVDLDNSGAPVSSCIGTEIVGKERISANATARGLDVSDDGSTVLYKAYGDLDSVAGTCTSGSPAANEIWARVNGTTAVEVSASRCTRSDCNAPANATFEAATPDASRVFFTTTQQLVDEDTDQANDLYACDLPAGNPAPTPDKANPCSTFRRLSAGDPTGAGVESVDATSDNGATVLFTAKGVLSDNEDALGEPAVAGDHNLYVWRAAAGDPEGQTSFLGRLGSNDLDGTQVTPDGRFAVFTTATQLIDSDTDNARDAYRVDADTGELIRASTNVFGLAGNGEGMDASLATPRQGPFPGQAFETNSRLTHPAISDDGTKIVFTTAEPLKPSVDNNDEPDVYLWTPARVALISAGAVGSGGNGASITGSGQDIYFGTEGALTPTDGDSAKDIYDARVDGGFSFAQKEVCIGESCQPEVSPPLPPDPSESDKVRQGNPTPPKACPKGKVRKHGKCVRKTKKHRHKRHRGEKAGHKQGGGK